VSVLVMDCTTTGMAEPTGTPPIQVVTVGRLGPKVPKGIGDRDRILKERYSRSPA
jgi:hypothetical protein